MPNFLDGRTGSFEAIQRTDGVLVTANAASCIGSRWIALLDEGDSIESLLPEEDQEFLAKERADAKAIWGDSE